MAAWRQFFFSRNARYQRRILRQAEAALKAGSHHRVAALLQPFLASSDAAQAYMLLGRSALEQQQWLVALSYFGDALRMNPQQRWGWALYGYAALQAGKLSVALTSLQYARHLEPTNIAILECLYTIAKRIDSNALRHSIEADLMRLDPKTYSKHVTIDTSN